jgi:thymidylate synthase
VQLTAPTLDDLLREVIIALGAQGQRIQPGRGDAVELTGVLLQLDNPRARISQTEMRGKLFSCLGELLWYLAKSDALDFIEYYIPSYHKDVESEANVVFGAYGPRLFDRNGFDAFDDALRRLKDKPHSRRAVIAILGPDDLAAVHNEIPCTCTLQLFLRGSHLDVVTTMRSNDTYKGLVHDIFAFTMLQEIAARKLGVEVGVYKHFVGSLHLYDCNRGDADKFLAEGYQPTTTSMPAMPPGDPSASIDLLLEAEATLRVGGAFDERRYETLHPYWLDIIRLLRIFNARRRAVASDVQKQRDELQYGGYRIFADGVLEAMGAS